MRNKLHNCKNCLWSGNCIDEKIEKIKCDDFTPRDKNTYQIYAINEYNKELQERYDDSLDIIKEMCDNMYD